MVQFQAVAAMTAQNRQPTTAPAREALFQNFTTLRRAEKRLLNDVFDSTQGTRPTSVNRVKRYYAAQDKAIAESPFANLLFYTGSSLVTITSLTSPDRNKTSKERAENLRLIDSFAKAMLHHLQTGLGLVVGDEKLQQGTPQMWKDASANIFH